MANNKPEKISTLVNRLETEFIRGNTQISKHVNFSIYDTISRIEAYLNSKHITGENDSQGRPKPFFNIVNAAANIWMRATDIDRKHIKLTAKNSRQWLNSFFANVLLQDWMKREFFGQFLNEWGRVLARYGSAVIKFVENSSGLHITVSPWNRLIIDPVSFEANPKIEVLELTESELRQREGYDQNAIDSLINAKSARETTDKRKKDNRNDYYKLYEVHSVCSKELLTGKESDRNIFVNQMWVISFLAGKTTGKDPQEFVLYKGQEKTDPFMITHLVKEDGRSLAIGAVESLFDAQWIQNHSAKATKDQLDIASKWILQTPDAQFTGRNILTELEHGDILVTMPNMPIIQVANASHDTVAWQNYAVAFRQAGREAAGISEAMLGQSPKSGTAWRQTEAILNESYNLFELMTENKGLYLEQMLRERILPYLFRKYDHDEEIAATLEQYDIAKLDGMFIKNEAIKKTNSQILDTMTAVAAGANLEVPTPDMQQQMMAQNTQDLTQQLSQLGNQRFFKPSDISWKKQFAGIEWDIDIDITGEQRNLQEVMTTLNTALRLIMTPGFNENPKAQAIVGRILDIAGGISPIEWNNLPSNTAPTAGAGSNNAEFQLSNKEKNINATEKA